MIVIQDHTREAYRRIAWALVWPINALWKPGQFSRLPSAQVGTLARYVLCNLRSHPVRTSLALSAPYRIADSREVAVYFQRGWKTVFPGARGLYVFSAVGFNANHTQALLHVDYHCALCGEGNWVLMRKLNGRWVVETTASAWIS